MAAPHLPGAGVKRTGVRTRTLHRWPGGIGETINPFAGSNVVPIGAVTSRQRRAAKRSARKGCRA